MPKLVFCIIIPVYNEEEIILKVISQAKKFIRNTKSKIIIINDGSTDCTKKKLARINDKRILILNKKNEGHGKTLIFGYKKAIKLKAKYVLQIDSDDQISFNEFKKLLKFKDNYNLIVGNRNNRDDPFNRILISMFMKFFIFLLYGKNITDPNCPLRIIKSSFLKKIINQISFSIIPNVLISIFSNNVNSYKSINIKQIKRYTGSSIKFFKLYKTCAIAFFDIFKFKFLQKNYK